MLRQILSFMLLLSSCLYITSANGLGVEPSRIDVKIDKDGVLCQDYTLTGDDGLVFLSDSWADRKSNDLSDFVYKIKGLEIVYPKSAFVNNRISICIKVSELGQYNGVLLFDKFESNVVVGSWINVNVTRNTNFLTGNVLREQFIKGLEEDEMFKILIFESLFLLCLLFLMFFIIKKKGRY